VSASYDTIRDEAHQIGRAFQLDGFHRLRDSLLQRLEFRQGPRLCEHDLVKLVILVFQMGQVRFDFLKPFREFYFHAGSLTEKAAVRIKNGRRAIFTP